ncbi:MAG: glutathione S-transferase family protein [Bdellovibrionota bacterium]
MKPHLKLYGSLTSPFTRRLRVVLDPSLYEFILKDIFSPVDRESFKSLSPVMKVPVLQDGETLVYDSRLIHRYLGDKGLVAKLDWSTENLQTIIEGVSDSLVNMLLLKRSSVVLDPGSPLGLSHAARVTESLAYLEKEASEGTFGRWDFVSISLYCLIDWARFRELVSMEKYPHLLRFTEDCVSRPRVVDTDPRNA